ncbi:12373_t:CDS:2 [Funneliformis caledonium]|uniref:12373_t:CDS:1 n=1 Tax=Funneliformis caledonium TaxID=1117310 RepID=A0A9N9NA05_9GLOM|nr:12373_t:CDS:2 [Funneliformis caledonium]
MTETEKKYNVDNIAYNKIHLISPRIRSHVNLIDFSKFFTVDATISYGTSTDKHTEVEQLYNLLVITPLSLSTLEQLERIYDGEFKVICEMIKITNYASSSNSDNSNISEGPGENKINNRKR